MEIKWVILFLFKIYYTSMKKVKLFVFNIHLKIFIFLL